MRKMKVKIVNRRIYLPKKLLEKAKLPENGSCEASVVGDEIIIRRPVSGNSTYLRF
jgi:bifunctional DNA-binding transcriptional regulator/antitoxin component of YhaV-PrlF toxin-antitoxin module